MKVAVGNDHAGYRIRQVVLEWLMERGHEVLDFGSASPESVDYPDHVHPVAEAVKRGDAEVGILVCGTGQGVSMTANKHQEIRAALCWIPEIASLSRSHNDANILCLPGRYVEENVAKDILDAFFSTEFEGGRHERRIRKLPVPSRP
ncbi:MAG: ribose 5-phosphate isomerase B [Bacteroidales bacterium]